ncbi:hypothetical protein [Neoaquamicrobium sediminum]|uniref:hypothetical protein n=1 Tax=Neoaquamicrobium sediminum TaxID=1849104 RepID=UPI00156765C3|nr:hypothetical protein [Mesorhizobium sediminum]NRC54179.1 hypothetical protein [Mesorhizobium sediminum]
MRLMILPAVGLALLTGYFIGHQTPSTPSPVDALPVMSASAAEVRRGSADLDAALRELRISLAMTTDNPTTHSQAMCANRYDRGSRLWKRCSSRQTSAVKEMREVMTGLRNFAEGGASPELAKLLINSVIECRDRNMRGGTDWDRMLRCSRERGAELHDQYRMNKLGQSLTD